MVFILDLFEGQISLTEINEKFSIPMLSELVDAKINLIKEKAEMKRKLYEQEQNKVTNQKYISNMKR
jgi:hypothetical protein